MRALSFHGFLKQYLRTLSGLETESVYKLLDAVRDNPRLREPLLLYALLSLSGPRLERFVGKDTRMEKDYAEHFKGCSDTDTLARALEQDTTPNGYKKVYRSYIARRDAGKTEQALKELIRKDILRLQRHKPVSQYRVYKDLGINPGNYDAFVNRGQTGRVSLELAQRIFKYWEHAAKESSR